MCCREVESVRFTHVVCVLFILPAALLCVKAKADDWPQWLGPKRDGVWRERDIIKKFPTGGPKVNWRVPIGGGYAGPAVANGRVFIMDRQLAKDTANPDNQFDRGMIPGSELSLIHI